MLEFDSEVQAGTGNIVLSGAGLTTAVTVAVPGDEVRVFGRYVVVDPVAVLDSGSADGSLR